MSDNVPFMFRLYGCAEIAILAFALYFIWIPPYELENEDEIRMPWNEEPSFKDKLKMVLKSR